MKEFQCANLSVCIYLCALLCCLLWVCARAWLSLFSIGINITIIIKR